MTCRTSEARRLRQLVQAAESRAAERCKAIIIEELTAAGVQLHERATTEGGDGGVNLSEQCPVCGQRFPVDGDPANALEPEHRQAALIVPGGLLSHLSSHAPPGTAKQKADWVHEQLKGMLFGSGPKAN